MGLDVLVLEQHKAAMRLVLSQEMLWEMKRWDSGGSIAMLTLLRRSHCRECRDTALFVDLIPFISFPRTPRCESQCRGKIPAETTFPVPSVSARCPKMRAAVVSGSQVFLLACSQTAAPVPHHEAGWRQIFCPPTCL